MGWFDSDNKEKQQAPQAPASPASATGPVAAPAPKPARPVSSGSTVGGRMKVTGTILSEEDLQIVGQVEGEIRARETLSISKEAEVRAVVHGRRIVLEGSLQGDIHASELVVLGANSTMQGDIHTPSLEIREGALFRGSVKMKATAKAPEHTGASAETKSSPGTGKPQSGAEGASKAGHQERPAGKDGQQKLPATSSAS